MNSVEWSQRELIIMGSFLIATGLAVLASRRHLVTIFLGLQVCLLGAVLIVSGRTDTQGMYLSASIVFCGPLATAVGYCFVLSRSSQGESLSIGPLRELVTSDRHE
jgi:hypothetical protein